MLRAKICLMSSVMLLATSLSGCILAPGPGEREPFAEAPTVTAPSPTSLNLETLPPPSRKVDVAVYKLPDLTGQNKPNDNIAEYSRAVTQGGAAFLVDALRRAGNGEWFAVVERSGLNNLLQERQLIRATRQEFQGETAQPLPPIRFAGLIIEGGILSYDGVRRMIVRHQGSELTLATPFPALAAAVEGSASAAVTIAPGCDKSLQTCLNRFDNIPRFGGFPQMTDNPFQRRVF